MKKEQLEQILNRLLSTGGDFGEIFLEESISKNFNYIDNRLDKYNISSVKGMGLRLAKDRNIYYGAINDFNMPSIFQTIDRLNRNINDKVIYKDIKLNKLVKYSYKEIKRLDAFKIKSKLEELNKLIRSKDKRVEQVRISVSNKIQNVIIARENGRYVFEERPLTRIFITTYFKDKDSTSTSTYSKGIRGGMEIFDLIDFEKEINEMIIEGIDKLYAGPCVGKKMPVIISNAFGGVIFHEACGHAMEATSVADGMSVLANDLDKNIASKKVTIIDDGTIPNEWGTTIVDDEGNNTQKNVLIKDGKLVNFLIDEINNRKMEMKITGSGRRESYLYAPTSRMNNTYLKPGTDTLEDMIKSIKFGLYAKKLGGGCVSPETGDFNFNCDLAYMIRDGKICECVNSASLIGNTKEILKNVEMVGNDLALGCGMCGSISGYVPVNVGEPSIKLSEILVGGSSDQ